MHFDYFYRQQVKLILRILFLYPVFVAIFLFLPAGSFLFWEAWIYSVVLFIPLVTTLLYLVKNDPELLERRLRVKEKETKSHFNRSIRCNSSSHVFRYDYHVFIYSPCPGFMVGAHSICFPSDSTYIQDFK